MEDITLAQRAYAVLERVLEESGLVEPGHSRRAADRAMAERFSISVATARNWRRGRQQHVSARVSERLLADLDVSAPQHAGNFRTLHDLAHRLDRIDRIAERLVREIASYAGPSRDWHIYVGPLALAFEPRLTRDRRADITRRAAALLARVGELGFDHRDVPALPELVRSLLHLWHHVGVFGLRARTVQSLLARAGQPYLDRIERALYLGDICTMPGLFTGDLEEAARTAAQARAHLHEATKDDEAVAAVSRRDADTMLASVHAQILACHAPQASRKALRDFVAHYGTRTPDIGWIDGVRQGALGYIAACVDGDDAEAADRFAAANERAQTWLQGMGLAFGSTPHRALAACAATRAGGRASDAIAVVHQALLEAREHAAVVDEVAARRAAEALWRREGDLLRAVHHAERATEIATEHDLRAWDEVVSSTLAPATARGATRTATPRSG